MKGKFGVKLVANIFIILSSLGILFSLAGIAGTWIYKPRFLSRSVFCRQNVPTGHDHNR